MIRRNDEHLLVLSRALVAVDTLCIALRCVRACALVVFPVQAYASNTMRYDEMGCDPAD